ncbi:hypothetical protein [Chryseobacterium potabilaquae]|uniref:GNAT family N-acetyltransferase n=1 Tax=Chryseobacterium potabilaquae TaxID=2675057 RepID=A0A6N4X8F3_9FLAO|nr:hypothetical protein [Chryseobacterium potabilaquae]CAA7195572.1 hypothetical protein CHRY9293_01759 [Chryseobacterium potabilaquae]
MIRKLRYQEIDFEKYSRCLDESCQKNWYARKNVLDKLSGKWHILVYGDYEAVMPIHLTKKFGFNFVHMPLFCQQLGIFSKKDDSEINHLFLAFLKKEYWVFLYSFNQYNNFPSVLEKKKNYIIPISDYEILRRKKYFKGRKSTTKSTRHLIYKELSINKECMMFIEKNSKGIPTQADFEIFKKYLDFLITNKFVTICGAYLGDQLISLALLITENKELSLLALFNDEEYKVENGSSFIIDRILQHYIHEKKFNFMGSNIRGIEVFFKSFGAELHEYSFIENKILKKFT